MGNVIRESVKSSIASYLGLVIGSINVVLLYTKFLSPQELGLTRVLQDSALLLVSFAQLGSPFIIIKFFPQFADKAKKHNGFLSFILTYALIGFFIFTILFFGLQTVYLRFYTSKSPLIVQYFMYALPLVFGSIFINIFESYLIIHNKLFFPTFIREVFLRISNTVIIIFLALDLINFTGFLNLMILSYFLALTFLMFYVKKLKVFYLSPNFSIFKKIKLLPMLKYGLFTVIGGIGFLLSSKIDTIMLPAYQGLKETAIYSVALFIATVMEIPKKSLIRAVLPSLTFAINKKDINSIDDIYKKTSINLLIFGLLIFLLIWVNIDDLFRIIPKGGIYISGKTVLYIFLFSRMMDLITGVNNEIILYSKYYFYGLILVVFLGIFTVITNLIFIPIYGILGAAIASSVSLIIYLSFAVIVVWFQFHSQPFNLNTVKAIFLFLVIWIIAEFLKQFLSGIITAENDNLIGQITIVGSIFLKSIILTAIFIYSYIKLKISDEFSNLMFNLISRVKSLLRLQS